MIIYKITNLINNKVYIGKTTKTIEWRFKKHLYDAKHTENTRNHFHRALLCYGEENFKVEQIDYATTKEELNEKERYWINYYDSQNTGYNMTSGGDGGDTYDGLTTEELDVVKTKLSEKNKGKNNGMSKSVKCKSIITNEELHFDTVALCIKYFNIKSKHFVSSRISKKCNTLWRDEWMFAMENEEYSEYEFFDASTRKGRRVVLRNGTEEHTFNSKNKAIEFLETATKSTFEEVAKQKGYDIIYP